VLDFSGPEGGDSKLLRNVGNSLPVDTASFTFNCRNSVLSVRFRDVMTLRRQSVKRIDLSGQPRISFRESVDFFHVRLLLNFLGIG